ncbi:MAG: MerR family transcriptional regulator [Actinomycetota bacterium]|nr:MerR family transcriptional regulator [Actinomycetota bacterium]
MSTTGEKRTAQDAGKRPAGRESLLKMSQLVEASGVPGATIKHYLREGLLPEPVKTSRNMSWYRPGTVERIRLIKRLQEERFMPLKAIKAVIEDDPEKAGAMLEVEDRIIERALAGEKKRTSVAEVRRKYGVPDEALDRLAEIGILTPNSRGYSPSDVTIIEAMSRFRAGGYDERIGFTVYDTLRYKRALEALVKEEVDVLMERLEGEVEPEKAVEMIEAGAEPLKDLIGALHTKLMVEEVERRRA